MSDQPFNILTIYRDALRENPAVDRWVLADKVAEGCPSRKLRKALAQALHALTATELGNLRREVPTEHDDEAKPLSTPNAEAPASARCGRVANTRPWLDAWWPDFNGGGFFLRDATADQLAAHIADRRTKAATLMHNADQLETLLAAMQAQGVERVGDLDFTDLEVDL